MAKLNGICFGYFTDAMLVPLEVHQLGVSTQSNARMKNHSDLILGEVVYILIIYYI